MLNIIFDLDGTLINSRQRLFELFRQLIPSCQFSYDQYWRLKQNRITNEMILADQFGYDNDEIGLFNSQWLSLIETREFLELDENFPGIHATLLRLKERANLIVCTARQHRTLALEQLENLGLLGFLDFVLVTQKLHTKEYLIRNQLPNLDSCDWLIGDTGADIRTGKALNIRTCAVSSGFLSRDILIEYGPDLLLNCVTEFTT